MLCKHHINIKDCRLGFYFWYRNYTEAGSIKKNLYDYFLFYINIYFIIFVSPEKCGGMEVSLSPVNRGDKKQITQVCYLYIYCHQTDINKTYKNYDYKLCEFGTWMVLIFYSKKDHVKTDKVKKITFSLTIERQSSF